MKRIRIAAILAAGLCLPGLVGCGEIDDGTSATADPALSSTVDASPAETAPASPDEAPTTPAVTPQQRGEAPLPGGGSLVGTWEAGTVLGEVERVGTQDGYERVLYAAESISEDGEPHTCVSVGVRVDDRILRFLCAVTPLDDGDKELWGGGRYEEIGATDVAGPGYLVVGSAEGDVDVSVAEPGAEPRAVTGRSTSVLPDHTVFYDQGAWDEGWDPLQLAPLTVTTSAGDSLSVPKDSYES